MSKGRINKKKTQDVGEQTKKEIMNVIRNT